jgi:hypothetical protein
MWGVFLLATSCGQGVVSDKFPAKKIKNFKVKT